MVFFMTLTVYLFVRVNNPDTDGDGGFWAAESRAVWRDSLNIRGSWLRQPFCFTSCSSSANARGRIILVGSGNDGSPDVSLGGLEF